jgi:hypothetical protein
MRTKTVISEDVVAFKSLMKKKNIVVDAAYFDRYFNSKKAQLEIMSFSDYIYLSSVFFNPNQVQTVDKHSILQDIQYLKELLPRVYGGYEIFRNRGLDWHNFFAKWERGLSRLPSAIPLSKALIDFDKMFSKFIDNHFQFPFVVKRSKTSSCTLLGRESNIAFVHTQKKVFDGQELRTQPIYFGPQAACSSDELKQLLTRQDHDVYLKEFSFADGIVLTEEHDYSYLRIPTMTSDARSDISKIKRKKINLNTPLIVDLRSNKGFGNYELVHLLNKLAGIAGSVDYFDYFNTKVKKNKYVDTIADNFDLFFTLLYKTDDKKLDLRRVIKSNLSAKRSKSEKTKKINNKRPVVVLINRFVSSDGEAMVNYIRHFKNHIVIGENTSGSCEFVEPGLLFLPKTKLPLMVPRGFNKLKIDGVRSIDGFGLSPDVYIFGTQWGKTSILSCIKQLDLRVK